MAYSTQEAVSDGTLTLLDISIDYFDRVDLSVLFDGIPNAYPWSWIGTTQRTITFTPAIPLGVVVVVQRTTDISQPRHIFTLGAAFTSQSMDEDLRQVLQVVQEVREGAWGESTTDLRADLASSAGGLLVGHDPLTGSNTSVGAELLAHEVILEGMTSSAGSGLVGYSQGGAGAVPRTVYSVISETVSVRSFGATGDGITDDTVAITNAITYVQSQAQPKALHFPAGMYKVSAALPSITKGITIIGEGPRSTQILFSGAVDMLRVVGTGTRASDVTFRSIGLNGISMTSGYVCTVDYAQNVLFDNVYVIDPFNGVSLRQVGNVKFVDCLLDSVRGSVGVYAYGNNTTRNTQNDQIDILSFVNTVIQSNYVPGGPIPTAELVVLDGRVHTVQIQGLRLLSALRGLVTKNTPALMSNLVPRFITGTSLEMDNHYAECADFQACVDFWVDNLFAAGSYTADGIRLSSGVGNWCVDKGSINSNSLAGLNINGATDVTLTNMTVYNNSLVSSGAKSAVYLAGAGTIDIRGGLCGKATWLPAYTEKQKHGVELDSSFSGTVTCAQVDMRGNFTGPAYDNGFTSPSSSIVGCPGANPRGVVIQSVGASPYTYTAGLSQEAVNLYGGTGVVSTIGGVVVSSTSPTAFQLQPRQSVLITYATAPTMAINKS